MTDFADKNVLITGAVSGLGRLVSRKIAGQGAHVILLDKNAAGLESMREELSDSGLLASIFPCDLTDRAAIQDTAERVTKDCGPVDVLINNAGVVSGKNITEATDASIIDTFAVNTLALFWITRAFLPAMIERNSGHIVTIASAAGLVGVPRLVDYCSSKFAAFGFDESLRLELKDRGLDIRTTIVCPYYMNTGMFAGVRSRFSFLLPILEPERVADRIVRAIRKNRQRLIMPPFLSVIFFGRLLPPKLFDGLHSFLGVTRSMDGFRGRTAFERPPVKLKLMS